MVWTKWTPKKTSKIFCAFWANCFLTSKKNLKFHSAEVSVENSIQTGIRGLRGIVNAGLSWLVGTGLESPDDKNMNINELGSSGLNKIRTQRDLLVNFLPFGWVEVLTQKFHCRFKRYILTKTLSSKDKQ